MDKIKMKANFTGFHLTWIFEYPLWTKSMSYSSENNIALNLWP
jgi:hypothetical protein